jgi:hypothetical protein
LGWYRLDVLINDAACNVAILPFRGQKSVSLAGRRRCYDVFVGIPLLDKPGVLEDIERRFAIAASVVC